MARCEVGQHLSVCDPAAWEAFKMSPAYNPEAATTTTQHSGSLELRRKREALNVKTARSPKPSNPPPERITPVVPAPSNGDSMANGFDFRRGSGGGYPIRTGSFSGFQEGPSPTGPGSYVEQNGNGFLGTVERVVDVGERIAGFFGVGGDSGKREGKALVARNEPASDCPTGSFKVGNRCVAPGDAFPGGDPFVTQAGGQAVAGAFGMPAATPVIEQRTHRNCPGGMVLGKDNLCYPKAVLSRRSRFRKWRQPMRPLLTSGDRKAIRKAESVANKLNKEKKRLRKTKNALKKVL